MIITRKKKIPLHWAFYAQLPLILSIYGNMVINAPFLLMIKKFIDNPAAIMGLISIEVYLTILGGPFVSWLSDRIWTKYGRRKFFQGTADLFRGFTLLAMPFAPNLIVLIILRWLYGVIGDLGAPTQALAYEIVPPKQRGQSSGFKSAFMQLGNLVFFFLVLGRFDDVYFMGPFSHLTQVSGGTVMFWMAALLLFGICMFEFFGIKEIYPPGHKRLNDGRKSRENVFKFFVRIFIRDVLSKDLLPLYLLLLASVMFSFSLGMFGPLLFTEQWGYSLQDMGNTVAVGVLLGVVISLLAGWIADKTSKLMVFTWCTVATLVINIAYTVYVYYKPDFRPTLWEIIFFGNLAHIFGATKSVVSFPLFMEYVARNRMGAAGAGITLFNGIFRNAVSLFVGVWLAIWSFLFMPQAGYHIEAFFDRDMDLQTLQERLEANGVNLEDYDLQPLHQYGVDGKTSRRWWIHQNVKPVKEALDERKELENEIANLEARKDSIFTSEERADEIQEEIVEKRTRIEAIDERLSLGAEKLRERLTPALDELRYQPGEQIINAAMVDGYFELKLQTLEALDEEDPAVLRKNLMGPEYSLTEVPIPDAKEEGATELQPDIEINSLPEQTGLQLIMRLNPNYVALFETLAEADVPPGYASEMSSIIISSFRSHFGRERGRFGLSEISLEPGDVEGVHTLSFQITAQDQEDLDPEIIQGMLGGEDIFVDPTVTRSGDRLMVETVTDSAKKLKAAEEAGEAEESAEVADAEAPAAEEDADAAKEEEEDAGQGDAIAKDSEAAQRLRQLLGDDPGQMAMVRMIYPKVVDTLAAEPIYITVPQNTISADYGARVYEYFFSSQTIQILTDIFGLGILFLIIKLEQRGVLHRYGAEEDENR